MSVLEKWNKKKRSLSTTDICWKAAAKTIRIIIAGLICAANPNEHERLHPSSVHRNWWAMNVIKPFIESEKNTDHKELFFAAAGLMVNNYQIWFHQGMEKCVQKFTKVWRKLIQLSECSLFNWSQLQTRESLGIYPVCVTYNSGEN